MRIWKFNPETGCHELYFVMFGKDALVATIQHDDDCGTWRFINVLDGARIDFLWDEALDEAKTAAEEAIDEYLADQYPFCHPSTNEKNKEAL